MPAKLIKTPKYVLADGREFDTLRESQRVEIQTLFGATEQVTGWSMDKLSDFLVDRADEIVAILRQKPRKNASATKTPRNPRGRKAADERKDPEERPGVVAHTEVATSGNSKSK